ncbi:MAG: T9SS type A sorting domain-containing protein [Chitinophagaceae bacterium]|nr:T9SS type A sorting domain-containing protein [Chitinophagaceae bacterium]
MKQLYLFLFLFVAVSTQAQPVNQCPNCWREIFRSRMVYNQNITSGIRGYVEFLPNNYNPNGTKKYPVIINFHGRDAQGDGNSQQAVCRAACEGIGLKLEYFRFPEAVVVNGTNYEFIILTPQYDWSTTSTSISDFIDYALNKYKADPARVYMTGLSLGANQLMNYMSSSSANARKVAAVVSLAGCDWANQNGANNFGSNSIRYWGIHAIEDATCAVGATVSWATEINRYSPPGNPMGMANLTPTYNPGFPHDIFSTIYDLNWKTLPDNVYQKHITEWMAQYSRPGAGALPATLGAYSVLLKGKQVSVEWTTTLESNTDYFFIERAGSDMQFKQIGGKITAAGNSSAALKYSFSDPSPLKGTSFYRVVLMNKDGMPDIYEIKKITNRENGLSLSVSPVPATTRLQLSIELDESQPLNFAIRDINGRTVKAWGANFTSGTASLPISIESFSPGVYYLVVQGTRFNETRKFVKQ